MTARTKFVVALCALYGLLGSIVAVLYLVLWMPLKSADKQYLLDALSERLPLAVMVILIGLAFIGILFHTLYKHYVRAPLKLRERLLAMMDAQAGIRLPLEGPTEIQKLAATINEFAQQRDALQRDIDARIRCANAAVEEEKNRFAALISELSQSVIVCNSDGRILLYNQQARQLFQAPEDSATTAGNALIGLGRSIFAAMDRNLIMHALERIRFRQSQGSAQPLTSFIATAHGGQLIRVQMAPVFNVQNDDPPEAAATDAARERAISGYVLILDNITRSFDVESRRDMMLQSLTEGSRAALGSLRAAVENLLHYPDMEAEQRDRFLRVMRDEVGVMSERLHRSAADYADALRVRWPLEEMRASDLIHAAQRRIEQQLTLLTKTEDIASGVWIKVDSFSLLQGLTYLAARLQDEFNIREVRFRLLQEGRLAHLDLIWSGVVIGTETLVSWEMEPMRFDGSTSPLSLREVVERHGGELWFQRDKPSHRSFFRILLPMAEAPERMAQDSAPRDSRPEFYDFDLFRQTEESCALDDRLLSDLTYTVFDTETTGLNPAAGDEIIQIGATRIVNGRLLRGELFDQLVDPRRRVTTASLRIHGIHDDMLHGQPTIGQVLPKFHAFCEDTVLVAHNAAFDMRFLQVKERDTGVQFRQPVLDTLLLSAVVHPNQESHTLEAIAARLGINIVGRHTALGDALVTGEVFLKLIPLLAEQGITTLREARTAAERTFFAKVKY